MRRLKADRFRAIENGGSPAPDRGWEPMSPRKRFGGPSGRPDEWPDGMVFVGAGYMSLEFLHTLRAVLVVEVNAVDGSLAA